MLKKFILGSTAISWWTGGFVVSFMTVEGGYLLGTSGDRYHGFIINSASSVTEKLRENGSMGSE